MGFGGTRGDVRCDRSGKVVGRELAGEEEGEEVLDGSDDDKNCHLEWEWAFDITKDWQ